MKKPEAQAVLDQLPDEFDVEELMHTLYIQAKVANAEGAIDRGEVLTQEELERETDEWSQ